MTQINHELAALRIEREPEQESRGVVRRVVGWTVAVLLLAAGSFVVYSRWIAPSRLPQPELIVVRATTINVTLPTLTASGYLVAERVATISPKASGRVTQLGFELGSTVKEGQILAVLESEDVRAQVDEAAAVLKEAQLEYNRQRSMYEQGVTSRAMLDAAEAELKIARARVVRGSVALADNVVRAPFGGAITAKNTEVGEVISPFSVSGQGAASGGGSIATLTDLDSLEVEADVNESGLARLEPSHAAEVTVDAFPGRKWRGRLRQVVPQADRSKGTVKVKIEILDPKNDLLPDMSANVSFVERQRTAEEISEKPKIWIPAAALASDAEGSFVAVVTKDQRVQHRRAIAGERRDGKIEIKEGLQEGETIVAANVSEFEHGQRVRTKEDA